MGVCTRLVTDFVDEMLCDLQLLTLGFLCVDHNCTRIVAERKYYAHNGMFLKQVELTPI